MNVKIIVGVALLIGICGLVGYGIVASGYSPIPTPWDPDDPSDPDEVQGVWGTDIIIQYSDGTSDNLKAVADNLLALFQKSLSVEIDGKEVSSFTYKLSGRASGEGVSSVDVDLTDFEVSFEVWDDGSYVDGAGKCGLDVTSLPVDDSYHVLFTATKDAGDVFASNLDEKAYVLKFAPSGSLAYTDADGVWQSADLPDVVSVTVNKIDDAWVSVDFNAGYTTS